MAGIKCSYEKKAVQGLGYSCIGARMWFVSVDAQYSNGLRRMKVFQQQQGRGAKMIHRDE